MEPRSRWLDRGAYVRLPVAGRTRRIFVRRGGTTGSPATPALFLHGFPSSSWDWTAIEPLLGERPRVTFDFLGYGESEKPPDYHYRLTEQADLTEAVAAARGLRRAHVVAHDYGVSVAQELLHRARAGTLGFSIASVAFLNGGLYPDLHRPVRVQKLLRSRAGPLVARLLSERRMSAALSSVFAAGHKPAAADLRQHYAALASKGGPAHTHRLIRYIDDRLEHERAWVGALEQTSVPLQFIWGALDPVSGEHVAVRLRERFPGRVRTLTDVGHYPQLEAPERVAPALHDFWQSVDERDVRRA